MCLVSAGLPRRAFHIFWSDWWVSTQHWPCSGLVQYFAMEIRNYFFPGAVVLYVIYVIIVIAEHFAEEWESDELSKSKSKSVNNDSDADLVVGPYENLFIQFSASINPIDLSEWNSSACIGKISMILKVWKSPSKHIEQWARCKIQTKYSLNIFSRR